MDKKQELKYFGIFLLASIIISLVLLIVCDCHYHINDDFFISSIASGVYGQEYSQCLFYSKSILGWIIKILNLIYKANYYMIFQYILLAVASSVFVTITIERTKSLKIGIITFVLWWAVFFINIFTEITYTVVAGVVSIIGLIGIITFYDKSKRLTFVSLVLAVAGYVYRDKAFLLIIPLVMVYIILNKNTINFNKKRIIITLSSLLICIVFCDALDLYTYRSQEWREYIINNKFRTQLTDYKNEVDIEKAGVEWNVVDYEMLRSWRNDDSVVFCNDNLQKIVETSIPVYSSAVEIRTGIYRFFVNSFSYIQLLIIFILPIISLLCGKQKFLNMMLYYSTGLIIACYFIYKGRFPWRVSFVIMFGMTLLTYLSVVNNLKNNNDLFYRIAFVVTSILLVAQIIAYKKSDVIKYNLYKQIKTDKEHFYVLDAILVNAMLDVFNPIDTIPDQLMDNFVFIGGWLANSPLSKANCRNQGATNALDILGKREDVYFVTEEKWDAINLVEPYLQRHYDKNIKAKLAEKMGGGFISYTFTR